MSAKSVLVLVSVIGQVALDKSHSVLLDLLSTSPPLLFDCRLVVA